MPLRSLPAILVGVFVVSGAGLAATRQPPLPTLLGAAAGYVAAHEARASAIVFEERYVQELTRRSPVPTSRGPSLTTRTLRSELLVLNTPEAGWVALRDVFEVDGTPVRDRQDRLEKLFAHATSDAIARARAIVDEGARFNLGSVERNLNYPTMGLMFLRREHQERSMFSRESAERAGGVQTWAVRFQETARPTLIGSRASDAVASGRFWIEPDNGRVRRSRITVEEENATGTIDVLYGPWPGLDVLMPVSMEEELTVRKGALAVELIRGRAQYSNYKQFTVDVKAETAAP